jgi:hypothetical protein
MSDTAQRFSASLAKEAVYELDCSDDLELLEIYSPAVHQTVKAETVATAAAAR